MFGFSKSFETRELWVEHDGMRIYDVLYVPKGIDAPTPAVICSHFFGGTHRNSGEWAQLMAEAGYIAYAFDFCGGASGSRSSGETTECSILTERADLSAVLSRIATLDAVDERSVFLLGQSQGGAVSAMVAAMRPEDVAGLVLLYPAFVIHDDAIERFGSPENVPETYRMWQRLGRVYAVDAMGYDFYEHIGAYTGPVLLFHGDRDGIVPLRYAERAAETYADIDFEVVRGAGHGFYGLDQRHIADRTVAFIAEHVGSGRS